ncbi:MAG: hypothetical protein F6K42_08735 [Leptolyngbya sp. SIO1D8]|nr:hypothetical protein [Leptolyngbya sp. SIO1D8]
MSKSFAYDNTKKTASTNDFIPSHQLPGQRGFVVQQKVKEPQEPITPLQRARMARLDAGVMRAANKSSPNSPMPQAPNVFSIQQANQRTVQRLSFKNTDWDAAKKVEVTTGSGKGVVLITDQKTFGPGTVVVKAGEDFGAEVLVASNLLTSVLGSDGDSSSQQDTGGWQASTSQARVASPNEINKIKAAVSQHAAKGTKGSELATKTSNFLSDLDKPAPTIIFSYAAGQDFKGILEDQTKKHTQKKLAKGREGRSDSVIAQMWSNPGQMTLLGQATAVDLFTGNGDRIYRSYNPKNYRVAEDTKELIFIDNVQSGPESMLKNMPQFKMTGEEGFQIWKGHPQIQNFCARNYAAIAAHCVDRMLQDIDLTHLRSEDQDPVQENLEKAQAKMAKWFELGLLAGAAQLQRTLQHPEALVAGVPEQQKLEVLTNIIMRQLHVEMGNVTYKDWYQKAQAIATNKLRRATPEKNWSSSVTTRRPQQTRHQKLNIGSTRQSDSNKGQEGKKGNTSWFEFKPLDKEQQGDTRKAAKIGTARANTEDNQSAELVEAEKSEEEQSND